MQLGLDSEKRDCAVVIIGAGPCGLMLAIELGRRGVSTIVLEDKSVPPRFPSANATQARTMEHYRRLGSPTRCAAGVCRPTIQPTSRISLVTQNMSWRDSGC